jgi:hypothetical protein
LILAKASMLHTQAPAFYRFKIGDFEATITTDGQLALGYPHKNYLELSTTEINKQLTDNFQPLDNAILEQNAHVVNAGDKLIYSIPAWERASLWTGLGKAL